MLWLADFWNYHDWCMDQVLTRTHSLAEEKLDVTYPISFGSLRAVLHHLIAAEELWLSRWQNKAWQPLDMVYHGLSRSDLQARWKAVQTERQSWFATVDASDHEIQITYANSQREPFTHPLWDLQLHVLNHGIHHRAQLLNILRRSGQSAALGLDYLFYRLAHPTVQLLPATIEALRTFGFEVDSRPNEPVHFRREELERYMNYGDWANQRVLHLMGEVPTEALDREFEMGMGTLRKTMLHILDAEHWWYRNWTEGPSEFARMPESTSLPEMLQAYDDMVNRRREWLSRQPEEHWMNVTAGAFRGTPFHFRMGETLVQLCGHGTHHRAQAINMLRQVGAAIAPLDLVVWLREGH